MKSSTVMLPLLTICHSTYRYRILRQIVIATFEAEVVTQQMCQNWHNRVLGFVLRCLEREDIIIYPYM